MPADSEVQLEREEAAVLAMTAATLDRPATVDVAGPNDGYLGIEYPELTCPVTDDAITVLRQPNLERGAARNRAAPGRVGGVRS